MGRNSCGLRPKIKSPTHNTLLINYPSIKYLTAKAPSVIPTYAQPVEPVETNAFIFHIPYPHGTVKGIMSE